MQCYLCLLLSADEIGHECEVSSRWDEGKDTFRLPALKLHTWVETHIIKKTRILSSKTIIGVISAFGHLHTCRLQNATQLGLTEPTIKDRVRSGIPENLMQASITPMISANIVAPKQQQDERMVLQADHII